MAETYFEKGRAWIELDTASLRHNVSALRALLPPGCELMGAVKANAYGHGAVWMARELNRLGVRAFCTATVREAAELRQQGIEGELLILGYTHPTDFALLSRYDLTQTVPELSYARRLDSYGRPVKAHVAVDTGMHRLGERCGDFSRILAMFSLENLRITGLFTHLCTADGEREEDRAYAAQQAAAFHGLTERLRRHGYAPRAHILSSYGLLNFPEYGGAYARVGIALCGVLSRREDREKCPLDLRPVLSLKARVVMTRELFPGEGVGYGLEYRAADRRRIAVLSIGYADGVPRRLSGGRGKVLIHGCEAPILGRICMDQMMVDVTGAGAVKSGDTAVLIGRSGGRELTAYDLAEADETITNELLSRLGDRLERIAVE